MKKNKGGNASTFMTIGANSDYTYCYGKGCAVRSHCRRFTDGERIRANAARDENLYWWMTHCDEDVART